MRTRTVLLFLGVVAACRNPPVEPAQCIQPAQVLDGTWKATWQYASERGNEVLSLVQHCDSITGTGTFLTAVNPGTGTMKVAGLYDAPGIALALQYDYGATSVFTGTVPDSAHITGTEIISYGGQSYSMAWTFTRQ
jgi:hypothetical protein